MLYQCTMPMAPCHATPVHYAMPMPMHFTCNMHFTSTTMPLHYKATSMPLHLHATTCPSNGGPPCPYMHFTYTMQCHYDALHLQHELDCMHWCNTIHWCNTMLCTATCIVTHHSKIDVHAHCITL